jgi:hypothetical protein
MARDILFAVEPPINSVDQVRLDKTALEVFSSFEEADAADCAYWHSRTPEERLQAVELMRQSAYGYDPEFHPLR